MPTGNRCKVLKSVENEEDVIKEEESTENSKSH